MRVVSRPPLPSGASKWLVKNQGQLIGDPSIKVSERWKARRATMNRNGLVAALKRMAGSRYRCMYCGDSEGCDVEHYYPKADARWRSKVFDWSNLLWICAPCNRLKNSRFELDEGGRGVLLDPATDCIWDFYDYVEESGQLAPRSDLSLVGFARADATLREGLTRLSHDVVCDSRQRAARSMRRAIRAYSASAKLPEDQEEFIVHILDAGHPELCSWYLAGLGMQLEPFATFLLQNGAIIPELRARLNNLYPGVW